MDQSDSIQEYYDIHTKDKLRDFLVTNPRIEEAWNTIKENAPVNVKNIFEIGCGIGSICARMGEHFSNSNVVGLDLSPKSIELAKNLFGSSRISFVDGELTKEKIKGKFDLIVLMDVYEHIAQADRKSLHDTMDDLLAEKGRIILSFPTPHYLSWLRRNTPEAIQPVDEHITADVILELARATRSELILYKKVNIWHEGDYAHAVLERNSDFEKAFDHKYKISNWRRVQRGMKKIYWTLRRIKNSMFVKTKL